MDNLGAGLLRGVSKIRMKDKESKEIIMEATENE